MIRTLLFTVLALALAPSLYAAEVIKVKGKGVLVELKGDPAVNGDQFFLIAPDGKRRGIVRISKVKGDRAIGKLIKGKAMPGFTLEFKPGKNAGKAAAPSKMAAPSMSDGSASSTRSYWGALFGYAMDSMSVNVTGPPPTNTNYGTVAMSGSGFSAKGLFDYEIFSQLWFRGTAGLEMFNAAGDAKCGPSNNATCDAKLMYLSADFIGRFLFSRGNFRPWLGGGLSLLFPASKNSSALDAASISTTSVMVGAGGFDWFMSPTFAIPVSAELGLFPKSDEVEARWIAIRIGMAVPF